MEVAVENPLRAAEEFRQLRVELLAAAFPPARPPPEPVEMDRLQTQPGAEFPGKGGFSRAATADNQNPVHHFQCGANKVKGYHGKFRSTQ